MGLDGRLLAAGHGVPPDWINDAAGAELWAFYQVTRLCTFMPKVVTDCLGILQGLQAGPDSSTEAKKKLARTWSMIASNLDGCFQDAASLTTWMPSHGAEHSIGQVLDSNGKPITGLMWRANRLVDFLAKSAASPHRLPKRTLDKVKTAAKSLQHFAGVLGAATHGANNFRVEVTLPDGTITTHTRRDSTAEVCKVANRVKKSPCKLNAALVLKQNVADLTVAARAGMPSKRRCAKREVNHPPAVRTKVTNLQAKRDKFTKDYHLDRILGNLRLEPSSSLSAASRIEEIRLKVVAKKPAEPL